MEKIKYSTLEVYTEDGIFDYALPQHAFISNGGKAVAICDQNVHPVNEDGKQMHFNNLNGEIIDYSNCCENCTEIVKKLEDRETEVQRFYDNAVGEFHRLNYEIKEFEKVMAKLKLDRLKAQSDIKKAEMRADEFGLKCFL